MYEKKTVVSFWFFVGLYFFGFFSARVFCLFCGFLCLLVIIYMALVEQCIKSHRRSPPPGTSFVLGLGLGLFTQLFPHVHC